MAPMDFQQKMHEANQAWLERLEKGLKEVIGDVASIKGQLKLIGFLLAGLELILHVAEYFKH